MFQVCPLGTTKSSARTSSNASFAGSKFCDDVEFVAGLLHWPYNTVPGATGLATRLAPERTATVLAPMLGVAPAASAFVDDAIPAALMTAVATSSAPIHAPSHAKRFLELPMLFPPKYVVE